MCEKLIKPELTTKETRLKIIVPNIRNMPLEEMTITELSGTGLHKIPSLIYIIL